MHQLRCEWSRRYSHAQVTFESQKQVGEIQDSINDGGRSLPPRDCTAQHSTGNAEPPYFVAERSDDAALRDVGLSACRTQCAAVAYIKRAQAPRSICVSKG